MKNSLGRIEDYNKVLPVLEVYRAVQSEGSRMGTPTIIVRTTGCTHRCWFGEGGWCDSFYTSIHPEKGTYTFNDIIKMYDDNPQIKEMMVTGGSPSMHGKLVNELTHFANERGIFTTIETEGSHFLETDYPIDLISLSPKFSNSVPELGIETPKGKIVDQRMIDQHNKLRLNYEAISKTLKYHNDYHYKPVCNPVTMPDAWEEIEAFRLKMDIPKNKTYVMPPGDNREEVTKNLPDLFNFCAEHGFNLTGRDHIIAFDDMKMV